MAQPYAPLLQQMMLEFQGQRLESAERLARSILRVNSKDLVALQVLGLCMAMQGRVAESLEPFTKAASMDAKNPELLNNLAKAQHGSSLFKEATQTYEKLNRLMPNNPQIITDMGTSYAKLKDYGRAMSLYDKAIELQPEYYLVWSNRGNLFLELNCLPESLECYEKSLKLNLNYAEAWTNYGNCLFASKRFHDAHDAHKKALALNPNYAEAFANLGSVFQALKLNEEAIQSYQQAFSINPLHPYLMGQLYSAKLASYVWDDLSPTESQIFEYLNKEYPASIPLVLLQTTADGTVQKRCAEIYSKDRYVSSNLNYRNRVNIHSPKKIRVGYFSSDFNNHPVGILMNNLVQHHNKSKYEIFGFFFNQKSGDEIEGALLSNFDKSVDLFHLNDQEATQLILNQDLDFAVDLNGHTTGARTALFSRNLATIHLNFLGYAGTSGTDFYDFLIGDATATPIEHESNFTEKIARLPHSFFPVDTSISPDEFGDLPTRESQGLPQTGFIFSCFNNPYKITPQIFDLWVRLLKQVPDSVLWLSKASEKAMKNLQGEAVARGIDSNRLVFATRVPARKDHLSRLRLADLFLDTPNYNAHATAADALWAGVPVLTHIGETFAGRVAASQLAALDMPELIVNTPEEYFEKALELASNPQALKDLRFKLEANRLTAPLFNTKQYVQDLEQLYTELLEQKS